ncbi:MAG: pilin [Patescibacteria group bacterium]
MKTKLIVIFILLAFVLPLDCYAVKLENPLSCDTANCLLENLIRIILGLVAIFALAMFIWGGIQILGSGGNPERVKKGKDTLVWATIGIVVILGSWAFLNYVLQIFTSATS